MSFLFLNAQFYHWQCAIYSILLYKRKNKILFENLFETLFSTQSNDALSGQIKLKDTFFQKLNDFPIL